MTKESRSQIAGVEGQGSLEGGNYRNYTKNLWEGDGYIHYLGCGNGFTGIYICQNIKLYNLDMCSL